MSKRPLPASDAQVSDLLIFPLFLITASHAAFIFLCCVYGSHSFPYFSQSGQLIFFCMLSLADYALSLIFVFCNPDSFFICTLPLADYALSLIFIFCTKSACKLFDYFFFRKLIIPRSCAPTCSAWVAAARRRIALNCGRPHWFSNNHFLAKVPS